MKKTLLTDLLTLAAIVSMTACSQKPEDTTKMAEEHNEAKFEDNNKIEKDAEFLVEAAAMNFNEIQLGQLAVNNAGMQDVKDLGKMMEDVHTKSMNELKDLASRKNITLPIASTEGDHDRQNKLAEKKGSEFDKEYCDKMVDGHKDAISKFEKASTDCTDAEIKEWAASTLPALRTHLNHALTCQEKVKKAN